MGAGVADRELESIDDLLVSLGNISPKRVRLKPAPGTAKVSDVERVRVKTRRVYELVEGALVEKAVGAQESFVALQLGKRVQRWNDDSGDPGMILGEAGTLKLMKGLVRAPDLSFTSWDRLPGRVVPAAPVPALAPDLAVEVISKGNTREEMERKLKEYFLSDVRLVWFIDPRARTVRVFTSPDDVTELSAADTLDGGAVLPGFAVEVARLFDQLAPAAKPAKPGGKKPKKRK